MDQSSPKLSIITVCFNAAPHITATLQSAFSQTFQDFECIIVDGKSSDNTLDLLTPFQSKITQVVSEKDNGIYDAMNKGVALAKGEWVYFLNAGDSFFNPQVLEEVFTDATVANADFIYAKVQTLNEPTGINYLAGEPVTLKDFWFKYPICHQATFAKRSLFKKVGGFNTNYQLISDTEWFIRLFKQTDITPVFLDKVVAYYDVNGATYQKRMLGMREYIKASFLHFPITIAMTNLFSYPLIWLKVKIIRTFQHMAWFKKYREWKFKTNKA